MDKDVLLLLVGAGIALVTGIITSVVQHILSLRADRVRREREQIQRKEQEVRNAFTQPLATLSNKELEELINKRNNQGKPVERLRKALEERLAQIDKQGSKRKKRND